MSTPPEDSIDGLRVRSPVGWMEDWYWIVGSTYFANQMTDAKIENTDFKYTGGNCNPRSLSVHSSFQEYIKADYAACAGFEKGCRWKAQ